MGGRAGEEGDRLQRVVMRGILLLATLVVGGLLLWRLSTLVLMIFSAVLVAVLIRALADLIGRWVPVSDRGCVALSGLAIAAVLAGLAVLLGQQLREQVSHLVKSAPDLIASVEEQLGVSGLQDWIEERAPDLLESGEIAARLTDFSTIVVGGLGHTLIVVVAGVYLAIRPDFYFEGTLLLVPARRRDRARKVLETVGRALKLWLLGQLVAMAIVGTLTGVGLWLLGIQSALALGFIAGILEFIPFVGPVLSSLPAIALGLAQGPTMALWVIVLYLVIQQAEGSLITPLVQQQAVELPPALTILAIVAFGMLFGALGVLLATPLTVFCFVLVKLVWVRGALNEETEVPGER